MDVLKIHDINPDGVRIQIKWDKMVVGSSVFIPCIDTDEARGQVRKIADSKGWKIDYRVRVESGNMGVRIWRLV